MRKLKLLIALGSLLLLVFVSNQSKSKSNNTTEEKVKVVVILDQDVKIIRDILLYRSSSDVEKMAKSFPENSRFFEGIIINLNPGEDVTDLRLEIYADGQFIPGDMFIPGTDFLRGDINKSFEQRKVLNNSICQKLLPDKPESVALKSIGEMDVERTEKTVTVNMEKVAFYY